MKKIVLPGKGFSYKITVVDRWQENFLRYGARSPHEHPRSPHETKNDDDDASLSSISKAYESEIGVLTSMIADDLKDASTAYPLKWVLDAIHEAAVQNKRGWKYCLAILKRWHAQGNQDAAKKNGNVSKPATGYIPDLNDIERMLA